jgi:ATP-dependent helicase/nuclease subunit B
VSGPRRPRVATIHPGLPFLPSLVDALLDPASGLGVTLDRTARDFAAATIFVPTRRAARALASAFSERLQPRALLLPRIIPLGDPDDLAERQLIEGAIAGDLAALDLPPVIDPLERRFLLMRLVETWRRGQARRADPVAGTAAEAFHLAGALGDLIDGFLIEEVDWSRISTLVPAGLYDRYWEETRAFLAIAAEHWPALLTETGRIEAAALRRMLLDAEAERLTQSPPDTPMIIAGSTGTVPATARLMAAIAKAPAGAVVLPGLDLWSDDAAFAAIPDTPAPDRAVPGHPQSALKRLLGRLGVARAEVTPLGAPAPAVRDRIAIAAAALGPAEITDGWPALRAASAAAIPDAFAGVAVIEAADERLEALAIAIRLRAVLERPGATAALITPDRALAGRVVAELARWNITAADSAGRPLAEWPAGTLIALALAAVQPDADAVAIMALLRHPLVCLAEDAESHARAVTALELAALRGAEGFCGLAGLPGACADMAERIAARHAAPPLKRLAASDLEAAALLAERLATVLAPLADPPPCALSAIAAALADSLPLLMGPTPAGPDLTLALDTLDALVACGGAVMGIGDAAEIIRQLLLDTVVPLRSDRDDARIHIWGLLEARLLDADCLVLGGLNEGNWPPAPRSDPFLNRAMRAALGLSPPERRIAQASHDAVQALGAAEVLLSRALTVEGKPGVASRLLRRLDAFLGPAEAKALRARGQPLLDWAAALDQPAEVCARPRPAPRPPAAVQPPALFVTEVETLVRDPYAIYARKILHLAPLEPLVAELDGRDRGMLIHEALARFVAAERQAPAPDPLVRLIEIGREVFQPVMQRPHVAGFWWPRFEKVAAFFVEWHGGRTGALAEILTETKGTLALTLADGTPFVLGAKADRVERHNDGTLAIIDYKTGAPPGKREVLAGIAPQLTLTAAIAARGGFPGIAAAPVEALIYLQLGSTEKTTSIVPENETIDAVADRHVADLVGMLDRLRVGKDAFVPRRMPKKRGITGDYDHLARIAEWAEDGGAGDVEGER